MTVKDQVIGICNVPNRNNRIYTRETYQKVIDDFDNVNGGIFHTHDEYNIAVSEYEETVKSTHRVFNMRLIGNLLIGDVEFSSMDSSLWSEFTKGEFVFRTRAFGSIGNNGVVGDFKLLSIDAIKRDMDGFDTDDIERHMMYPSKIINKHKL